MIMKKFLLLALLSMFVLSSCSKGDDTLNEESPEYTGVFVNASVLRSFDITDTPSPLYARIEIYEGENIEKRNPDDINIAYDTKTNRTISPIAYEERDLTILHIFEINKTYFIFVKIMDSSCAFANGAYSYCIFKPTKPQYDSNGIRELTKIFSYNTKPNSYEKWDVDLTQEQVADFGKANWGDTKEVVKSKEKLTLIQETSNLLKYNQKTNNYIVYNFNSSGFFKGEKKFESTINTINGTGMLLGYLSVIDNLTKEYGSPTSFTKDVHQYDITSPEFREIGEWVAYGGRITYSFQNGKVTAIIQGDRDYAFAMNGKGTRWDISQIFIK